MSSISKTEGDDYFSEIPSDWEKMAEGERERNLSSQKSNSVPPTPTSIATSELSNSSLFGVILNTPLSSAQPPSPRQKLIEAVIAKSVHWKEFDDLRRVSPLIETDLPLSFDKDDARDPLVFFDKTIYTRLFSIVRDKFQLMQQAKAANRDEELLLRMQTLINECRREVPRELSPITVFESWCKQAEELNPTFTCTTLSRMANIPMMLVRTQHTPETPPRHSFRVDFVTRYQNNSYNVTLMMKVLPANMENPYGNTMLLVDIPGLTRGKSGGHEKSVNANTFVNKVYDAMSHCVHIVTLITEYIWPTILKYQEKHANEAKKTIHSKKTLPKTTMTDTQVWPRAQAPSAPMPRAQRPPPGDKQLERKKGRENERRKEKVGETERKKESKRDKTPAEKEVKSNAERLTDNSASATNESVKSGDVKEKQPRNVNVQQSPRHTTSEGQKRFTEVCNAPAAEKKFGTGRKDQFSKTYPFTVIRSRDPSPKLESEQKYPSLHTLSPTPSQRLHNGEETVENAHGNKAEKATFTKTYPLTTLPHNRDKNEPLNQSHNTSRDVSPTAASPHKSQMDTTRRGNGAMVVSDASNRISTTASSNVDIQSSKGAHNNHSFFVDRADILQRKRQGEPIASDELLVPSFRPLKSTNFPNMPIFVGKSRPPLIFSPQDIHNSQHLASRKSNRGKGGDYRGRNDEQYDSSSTLYSERSGGDNGSRTLSPEKNRYNVKRGTQEAGRGRYNRTRNDRASDAEDRRNLHEGRAFRDSDSNGRGGDYISDRDEWDKRNCNGRRDKDAESGDEKCKNSENRSGVGSETRQDQDRGGGGVEGRSNYGGKSYSTRNRVNGDGYKK